MRSAAASPGGQGYLGGELADPAHALGGRLGGITELPCHPADAAMDAELPHGGLNCLRYHFGARSVRTLQPGGEWRREACTNQSAGSACHDPRAGVQNTQLRSTAKDYG